MRKGVMAAAAMVALAGFGYMAFADEEKVPLDKVPAPIMDAVKKRFPKAEIVGAEKESENGKVKFEIEIKDGGAKIDVLLTPEGVITTIEKVIAAKDLPKAVVDAAEAKFPKATHKTIEEITTVADGKETLAYYEILLVAANGKTYEVEILADGKIKEVEEKKAEKKEEKK